MNTIIKLAFIIGLFILAFGDSSCKKEETTTCPTTSRCGCSSHNKADCGTDSCCKWVTGQGCFCN